MTHLTNEYDAAPRHLRHTQARWSAIFAGVAVTLAMLCFFQVLGLAIGVSLLDLTDMGAIGDGFGIGVVIWGILSWCASLFLGAMLTARLSGEGNEAVGLLNGVTLWAATSLVVMVLAYSSFASLLGGTFSLASSTVSASMSAVKSTGQAVGSAASYMSGGDSVVADRVIALLKDEASEAAASGGGPLGASADEIRRSIDQLDAETVRVVVGHLVDGDTREAADALADNVALSELDLKMLVERASENIQEMLGTAGNDRPLSEDVLNRAKSALASGLADLDQPGGTDVSRRDIRGVLDELDAAVLQTIAWRLVRGDADGARDALIANTSLSRAEADALIDGIETDLEEAVTPYLEEAEAYADTAGNYAQGVLWVGVFSTTLSLGAAAFGGWLGTRPVTRRVVVPASGARVSR